MCVYDSDTLGMVQVRTAFEALAVSVPRLVLNNLQNDEIGILKLLPDTCKQNAPVIMLLPSSANVCSESEGTYSKS